MFKETRRENKLKVRLGGLHTLVSGSWMRQSREIMHFIISSRADVNGAAAEHEAHDCKIT